jgi:hypothetical protein
MAAALAPGRVLCVHPFKAHVWFLLVCTRGIVGLRLQERSEIIEGDTDESPGVECWKPSLVNPETNGTSADAGDGRGLHRRYVSGPRIRGLPGDGMGKGSPQFLTDDVADDLSEGGFEVCHPSNMTTEHRQDARLPAAGLPCR